jgi:predicted alpha/beta hydrolase family esterase
LARGFETIFIEEMNNDNCEKKIYENCEEKRFFSLKFISLKFISLKNNMCKKYINSKNEKKCYNKNRFKKFQKNQTIKSKNGKKYKIIDSVSIEIIGEDEPSFCKYQIFDSLDENTNEQYVIFSTGTVLKNENWKDQFIPVFEKIYQTIDFKKNIILCGHSLGCSIALRFGCYLNEKIPITESRPNISIIGSAPFKCLYGDEQDKINRFKVTIFLNTQEKGDNDAKQLLLSRYDDDYIFDEFQKNYIKQYDNFIVDCFYFKGDDNAINYEPIFFIDKYNSQLYKVQNVIKNTEFDGDGQVHNWNSYFSTFNNLIINKIIDNNTIN